jgi:SAM-dependent methyltransferase
LCGTVRAVLGNLLGASKNGYRLFRKRVLHKDNRVLITPVMLRHIRRYDLAAREVGGDSVLDAACGSGYGKTVIGVGRRYLGIDVDPDPIAFATRNYGDGFQVGSVTGLELPDASFDAVVSFETLEHLDKPEHALDEFARVLRPGGRLVGSIPLNHPDLIYHARVYRFSDVKGLLDSTDLSTTRLYHQQGLTFTEITDGLDDGDGGTVVFVAERREGRGRVTDETQSR